MLAYLAATQADASDPRRDAEPGKILHETRRGEMAALGEVPFGRYYGSVDATPLFVLLAGAYFERTGDRALLDGSSGRTSSARCRWIDDYGDRDGDGFVEYCAAVSRTGWSSRAGRTRTTRSSMPTARWPRGRSRCAKCRATSTRPSAAPRELARALGRSATRAGRLEPQAEALRERVRSARSGARTSAPTRSRSTATSGRAGCAPRMPATACSAASPRPSGGVVARTLLATTSFSGWGIRTVAAAERATTRCPITTARSGRTTTP